MRNKTTFRLTLLAVFAAMTMALAALENALPPLPVPGARMGLSNVAVTAGMWLISPVSGCLLGAVKVGFTLLTRGVTAAVMAAAGTALSVGVTAALFPLYKRGVLSFIGIGIAAAAAHTRITVWLFRIKSVKPLPSAVSVSAGAAGASGCTGCSTAGA